jgi:hypothetical protein
MAERGMAGSGQELAAKLLSSQASAQRGAEGTRDLASTAYKRALDAMSQSGGLAGEMRSQEFDEESNKARAADLIARFNAEQRSSIAQRNLQRQQSAEDMRKQLARQQEEHNKGLIRQNYQDQLAKAEAMAQARTGGARAMAPLLNQKIAGAGSKYTDMAKGISGIAGSISNFATNNPNYFSSSGGGTTSSGGGTTSGGVTEVTAPTSSGYSGVDTGFSTSGASYDTGYVPLHKQGGVQLSHSTLPNTKLG